MGCIQKELYRDSQRIQNAFETGALELAGDKWKPSRTFFFRNILRSNPFIQVLA